MSANHKALPADFDVIAYETQIKTWLSEGHADNDILVQARHTWPTLPDGYTVATLSFLNRLNKPDTSDPFLQLQRIHRRRARHIRKVEKALDAESAPVSLHNLYRGLLRDHEAACHSMIAMQEQQSTKPDRKTEARQLSEETQKLKQQSNILFKELYQQYPQLQQAVERKEATRTSSRLGCLIALVLSLFLAGSSRVTAATPTILYTVPTPLQWKPQAPAQERVATHGHRQRTTQLFTLSAEDHQTLLQRTAHDSA